MAEYNDDLNYPDPFYISDIETYELLHVNEAGRRLFKVPLDADLEGVKCYEFLQGRDEPCPFCTNHLLSVREKLRVGIHEPFDEPSSSAERSSDQLGWEAGSS